MYINLRTRIILAVIFPILMLGLLATFFVYKISSDRIIESRKVTLEIYVKEKMYEISGIMQKSEQLSDSIAKNQIIKNYLIEQEILSLLDESVNRTELSTQFDLDYINNLLSTYNLGKEYTAIYILDKNGTTVASTISSLIKNNYKFRKYVQKALDGERGVEMSLGVTTNQLGYYFSSPIFDDSGKILGIAAVKLDPGVIKDSFINSSSIRHSEAILADNDGVIVYAEDEKKLFKTFGPIDEKISKQIVNYNKFAGHQVTSLGYDQIQQLINSEVNGIVSIELDEDKYDNDIDFVTLMQVEGYPFFLINKIEKKYLEEEAIAISIALGVIVLLAAICATGLVVLLTSKFLRPIKLISKIAEEIGKGNFDQKNPFNSNDEFGILGRTLENVGLQLKSLYSDLEDKVRARTQLIEEKSIALEDSQKAMINILEDVQLEKQKSQDLANDLEKFKLAVDSVSDHVAITDPDGIVLYGNDSIERITGYSVAEAAGKKAGTLWHVPMSKEYYEDLWETIKTNKKPYIGEIQNKRKNGEIYDALISISPVLDENENVKFFVAIERDITKEKQIDRAKTEFVSLSSHQLKTPLTSIGWYTEMLLDGDAGNITDEQRHYLEQIDQSHKKMVDLVNSLLNVSRIELGTFSISPTETNLIDLAEETLRELEHEILFKQLEIIKNYAKDLPANYLTDKTLMRIIFQNIFSNSVKYTPEKGRVTINIKKNENKILISVEDTGYGIPESNQERIFSRFFRADNVVGKEVDGNGLGLYIVRSILRSVQGKIWFKSEEGKGSVFYVEMPASGWVRKEGTKKLT